MIDCSVFDLGKHPICGTYRLPLEPVPGIYYMAATVGDHSFEVGFPEVTIGQPFLYINANLLPVNREIIFSIVAMEDDEIIAFDIDEQKGTACDPDIVETCYSSFRIFLQPFKGIPDYVVTIPV